MELPNDIYTKLELNTKLELKKGIDRLDETISKLKDRKNKKAYQKSDKPKKKNDAVTQP